MKSSGNRASLQQEIAVRAARLVAEDGHDFSHARLKAAAQVLGDTARATAALPDKEQIETALRAHLRAVEPDAYRQRLWRLRTLAQHWMQILAPFHPCLVGPVLNASATQHCPVHLHLFADSAKDVEMALLDRRLDIRVADADGAGPRAQERIGFVLPPSAAGPGTGPTAMLLTVFDTDALRQAPAAQRTDPHLLPIERGARADSAQLRQLLEQTAPDSPATAVLHA